jgi:hypothetical protein
MVKQQIEKARQEEKTKLYERITDLETENKGLKEGVSQKDSQLESLKLEVEVLKKSIKTEGSLDIQKLMEEVSTRAAEALKKQYDEALKKQTERIKALEKTNREFELGQLKTRLIQEAGGENAMVVALVNGDSEEALHASIDRAKQEYQKIVASVTANIGGNIQPGSTSNLPGNIPGASVPPNLPAAGGQAGAVGGPQNLLTNIRELSVNDYAKRREQVLAALKGRYVGAVT